MRHVRPDILIVDRRAIVPRSRERGRYGRIVLEFAGATTSTDEEEQEETYRGRGQADDDEDACDCPLVPEESVRSKGSAN